MKDAYTPEEHLFQILQLLIHGKDPLAAAQAKEASKVLDKVADLTAENERLEKWGLGWQEYWNEELAQLESLRAR